MNKKKMAALGLLSATCFTTNVNAEEIIYGEDIPAGEESEYVFVENENILDAYKDLSSEEANSLKIELEASGYTTVTIKSYMVKTGVITNKLEKHFDSYNEAKAYIEELKSKGISVENVEFIYDTEQVSGSINETYSSLEEAEAALESFQNEYNEETTGEVTENKTDTVIEEIEGTTPYTTLEEASSALEAFLAQNETDEFYFTGVVDGPKGTGEYTESIINETFTSQAEALAYIESLINEGYIILNYTFTNDTEQVSGSINETYNDKNEAEAALESFQNEYNEETTGEVTENKTDTVIEEIEGTTPYTTLEEASSALEAFLAQNETDEFYFTGVVDGPKGTGEYTESVINETFTSQAEALAYIESLIENGYIILNYTFTNDTEQVSGSINETYDTEAEAESSLANFTAEYTDNVTSNIEKVHDESEDVLTPFSETFDNETDADTYLAGQEALNSDDVVVTGSKVTNTSAGESVNLPEEVFESEAAANVRLAEISNQYDVVESSNIEMVNAGTIYHAERITAYESEYAVGNSVYIIVKKGNKVYVWTLNELSSDEIAEFKRTYPDFQVDSTISVNKANFIHGLNSEFLSGNNKPFTIVERDGELYAIMSPGSVSHAVYGNYTPITEYHLTAIVHNNIYSYTVSGNILTKGYDYTLTATGKKTVTLASGTLEGNKKIENEGYYYNVVKKAKTYTVTGTGKKTVTLASGNLKADTSEDKMEEMYALDLVRQKYEFMGGIGGDEEETINPQTADDTLWVFTIGGVSLIGAALSANSLRKKEEE